jgi:hypothetical protein
MNTRAVNQASHPIMPHARRRRWADILVLIAAVYAFLSAFWSPLELVLGGDGYEVDNSGWLMGSYALAGILGISGVLMAVKNATVGRIMVALGGVAMLSAFGALQEITPFAALSIGLSGLVLLAGAYFVGPMPTPEDEGKRR